MLDETLTLLRARGQSHIAVALGAALLAESLAVLHFCTKDEIQFVWDAFQRFSDKEMVLYHRACGLPNVVQWAVGIDLRTAESEERPWPPSNYLTSKI